MFMSGLTKDKTNKPHKTLAAIIGNIKNAEGLFLGVSTLWASTGMRDKPSCFAVTEVDSPRTASSNGTLENSSLEVMPEVVSLASEIWAVELVDESVEEEVEDDVDSE